MTTGARYVVDEAGGARGTTPGAPADALGCAVRADRGLSRRRHRRRPQRAADHGKLDSAALHGLLKVWADECDDEALRREALLIDYEL